MVARPQENAKYFNSHRRIGSRRSDQVGFYQAPMKTRISSRRPQLKYFAEQACINARRCFCASLPPGLDTITGALLVDDASDYLTDQDGNYIMAAILEHHRYIVDGAIADANFTAGDVLQPCDQAQSGRLAAA
jgi:hypothetical protein